MKRRLALLLTSFIIFIALLSIVVFPPVFAGNNDNGRNDKHKVNVRSGNTNSFGGSNSTASVHNDNSVHITQNGNGGGRPELNRNNHNNNNHKNNHKKNHNDNDKKVVRKDVDKKVVENVIIHNDTPEVVVPPVINHNENVNENVNINQPAEVVRHETVVEERIIERPVQEVASYQDYEVYPVKEISVTPETGGEMVALFSLPMMGGAGFILRRKFSQALI